MQKFELISNHDRLPLHGLVVVPKDCEPKAILQILHGMCEHKERYAAFLQEMTSHGFVCAIHDHRGHGESVRQKEDLGYFYQDGGSAMVTDAYQVTQWIQAQFPNLPLFLLGHSMGSLVARCYLKRYPDVLDGLILCGSPSAAIGVGLGERVRAMLARKKGEQYHSEWLGKTVFSGFEKPFRVEGRKNAWLCRDSKVVDAYNQDPLCTFNFSLNGYEALLYLLRNTYDTENWNVVQPNLPIRFLSGAEDPCRGNDAKFNQAVELLRSVGYTDVTARLFPGMRHEILNELQKELVYADVQNTLEQWIHS